MTDTNWNSCLAFVFSAEGGYVDDPQDPGGATNFGITIAELAQWRGVEVSRQDVQALTKDEAAAIYRANYWKPVNGPGLPGGIDLMVFDAAVNNGAGRSAKFLQQAAGVTQDGWIGPATLQAVSAIPAATLIPQLAEIRNAFYQSLPSFSHFGHGWLARVQRAQELAAKLAA